MKEEQDYIRDITEIRTMMERSSRFLSLSGLAGVMAGIYALAGAYLAYTAYDFRPEAYLEPPAQNRPLGTELFEVSILSVLVLVLAIGTALVLSYRKATLRGERAWNGTTRRVIYSMAVPLAAGGILILLLLSRGQVAWVIPMTLVFYGLAQYNASRHTYKELQSLGLLLVGLGLLSAWLVTYSILIWALGFGLLHIVYGVYLHYKYER